jgi:hypothetical protein
VPLLIAQLSEGALDHSGQLLCSTVYGLIHGCGQVCDRGGLAAFKAGFHHATYVVIAALFGAVLIAQVNFHSRDGIAESTQGTFHDATDLSGQGFVALDVTVGIELDLHGVLLGNEV